MIFNYMYTDRMRPYLKKRNNYLSGKSPNIDLMLFGDSILQGYDINRYYPATLTILNSAIGGDRLPYMISRMEEDVLRFNPKAILFLGGINDIRAWQNEERSLEDFEQFANSIVLQYQEVIESAQKNKIRIYPMFLTKNQEQKHNYIFINHIVDTINCKLKQLEAQYNLSFIDLNSSLANDDGLISLDLTSDGLHPNELGYLAVTEQLLELGILR